MRNKKSHFKAKKIILKGITYIMGIVCLLSELSLDSEPYLIPAITLVISGAWLWIFGLANGWFETAGEDIG